MSDNRRLVQAFAEQFDPPLAVHPCANIDGKPVEDGFMCAFFDDDRSIGVTALAWGNGRFKAFVEITPKNPSLMVSDWAGRNFALLVGGY